MDNGEIIGLELITASATNERVESKFGHSLFRFVDTDNDPGNDITISFVADVNGPKASNISGIVGSYGVYPEVKSLRLFVNQYIKQESRPLERHLIPSNSHMRLALIDTLQKWWEEIHIARETIYEKSLNEAVAEGKKKAEKIFGKGNFELFNIKFFDEVANKEITHAIGLLKKEGENFNTSSEKDSALYKQAYSRAFDELNMTNDDIALNFFHEIWKVSPGKNIIELESNSLSSATTAAKEYFETDKIKIFEKFSKDLVPSGYYAISIKNFEDIKVLKKAKVELAIKNLEIKSAASEELGKYTFFSNNCAGAVIKFLDKSNFPSKRTIGIQGRVPVKLNKWMSRSLLVPYPPKVINGANKLEKKVARILGFSEKEYLSYRFPIHQWKIISKYISNDEKFLFYDLYNHILSPDYLLLIRSEIEALSAPDYSQIYGLEELPEEFYSLCTNMQCAREVLSNVRYFWSKKEIKKTKRLVARTGNNTFIHDRLTRRPEVLEHLKLLEYIPHDFGNK